jgi:hypothetical protein
MDKMAMGVMVAPVATKMAVEKVGRFEADFRRGNKRVIKELGHWWKAAKVAFIHGGEIDENCHALNPTAVHENALNFAEYKIFYMRLVHWINTDDNPDNDLLGEDLMDALIDDWYNDSLGDGFVDKPRYLDSVYELAITWLVSGLCAMVEF